MNIDNNTGEKKQFETEEGNNERGEYSGNDVAHNVSSYAAKMATRFTKCCAYASLLKEENKDRVQNKLFR